MTQQEVFEELFQKNKNTDMVEIKEQSWAKMNELELKNWDDYRKPYASVIKNLLNNIDICNRRYAEEGEEGYLVQRDVYKKEIEELKASIKKKEG
jgi:hypothetical protein